MEIKKSIAVFIAIFWGAWAYGQDCDRSQPNFVDGEELVYQVYYNWRFIWIPAGEATFKLVEEDDHYKAEAVGANYPSYERLFRVRDRFQSRFHKETFRPFEFLRTIEEGKYRRFDSLQFDREHALVNRFQGKYKTDAEWTRDDVDPCVYDLLSIIYRLRTIDESQYKKGDKIKVDIYLEDRTYPIQLTLKGKQMKNIKNIGKVRTLLVSPELISGTVFNDDDHMNIWVSDDENKIPLLIESPIKVGSVKVILKSAKGLKYPSNYERK